MENNDFLKSIDEDEKNEEVRKSKKPIKIPKTQFASLPNRFFAFLIDEIALAILLILIAMLGGVFLYGLGENLWWISAIIMAGYFIVSDSFIDKGQTIGKKIFKISVVNKNGNFVNPLIALIRFIPLVFVVFSSGISISLNNVIQNQIVVSYVIAIIDLFILIGYFIFPLFHYQKRGLVDIITGSYVVNQYFLQENHTLDFSKINNDVKDKKNKFLYTAVTIVTIIGIIAIVLMNSFFAGILMKKFIKSDYISLYNELRIGHGLKNIGISFETQSTIGTVGNTKILYIEGWVPSEILDNESQSKEIVNGILKDIYDKHLNDVVIAEQLNYIVITLRTGVDLGLSYSHSTRQYDHQVQWQSEEKNNLPPNQ
ncbi:MAG: RDD family protein [Candidatus Buchananbacteria bacterium]|nr:RDD family protein [Candidatus Buchananbacteria bacterium]